MAAWSRTDWDEECVTTYRHVPKCRPCLRRFDSSAPSAASSAYVGYTGRVARDYFRHLHVSLLARDGARLARCRYFIRARLLARSETNLPRRRRPRCLARLAHRPVRDVRR